MRSLHSPLKRALTRAGGRLLLRKLRYVEGRGDTTVLQCTHVNPGRQWPEKGKREAERRQRQAAKRAGRGS